jgi:hypothetical protein
MMGEVESAGDAVTSATARPRARDRSIAVSASVAELQRITTRVRSTTTSASSRPSRTASAMDIE